MYSFKNDYSEGAHPRMGRNGQTSATGLPKRKKAEECDTVTSLGFRSLVKGVGDVQFKPGGGVNPFQIPSI